MSDKSFKVDEAIVVTYQPPGATTGTTCTMTVYDEAGVEDAAQSGVMSPKGSTGRFNKSFVPDAEGLWEVHVNDSLGGKSVKTYSVGSTNIAEIGATVTTLDAKVDTLQTTVESIKSPPIMA